MNARASDILSVRLSEKKIWLQEIGEWANKVEYNSRCGGGRELVGKSAFSEVQAEEGLQSALSGECKRRVGG